MTITSQAQDPIIHVIEFQGKEYGLFSKVKIKTHNGEEKEGIIYHITKQYIQIRTETGLTPVINWKNIVGMSSI